MTVRLTLFFVIIQSILFAQPDTEVYLFDLTLNHGKIALDNPRNISNNDGYDNQPSFLNDTSILFAATRDGQTDILRFNIEDGSTVSWLTDTPTGSEYSPLKIPNKEAISAIRLDIDGLQRLYAYDMDTQTSKILLKDLKVGYHVWYTEEIIVATVLTNDRMDLVVCNLTDGTNKIVQKNVGRSLQRIPNTDLVSFISKEKKEWELKSINPITGATQNITSIENTEDICWLPNGSIIIGKGKSLYTFHPTKDTDWALLKTFTDKNINNISRIAVNSMASRITFAAEISPEKLVQKQLDAYNSRNIEAFLDTFSNEVAVYNFPLELRYKGIEKMREKYTGFFESTPDLHCEIRNRIVIGNKVIDEEYVTANGNSFSACAIYEVENGKITKVTFLR